MLLMIWSIQIRFETPQNRLNSCYVAIGPSLPDWNTLGRAIEAGSVGLTHRSSTLASCLAQLLQGPTGVSCCGCCGSGNLVGDRACSPPLDMVGETPVGSVNVP